MKELLLAAIVSLVSVRPAVGAEEKAGPAATKIDSAQDAVLPALPFQEVRCPTLILHGTRDRAVPFSQAEATHAQIPGSRLVRYDAGHTLLFRNHREVASAIDAFLAEHEPNQS